MLEKELRSIFDKVQKSTSCHTKCAIMLTDLYKKAPEDDFRRLFLKLLYLPISHNRENSIYTNRVLSFISRFCSEIAKKEEKEKKGHDFLTGVIKETLSWSKLAIYDIRYNSCLFLSMVLQDIGEEVRLELNLIDDIQIFLLERMQEGKVSIRLAAMSALVRLQDPINFECPVINAYIVALMSGSAQIRKEAVKKIAPNMTTLRKIRERVMDLDPGVRSTAFQKCADVGPLNFRIADRHVILLCGFQEKEPKVKNTFLEYLLPKWLTAYKGDYLKFVASLKLIASDQDITLTTYLIKELICEFFKKHHIDDLIAVLPINDEKLINVQDLTNDVTLFWSVLISLLRQSDDAVMDDYLNQILPELTPFCHYLDRMIKIKSAEQLDEWKFAEYQFDLLNLIEIAENYDFSDEVGRRTMRTMLFSILQNYNFTRQLTKKLVSIAYKCSSNLEFFTTDICQLMADIKEPLTEDTLSQEQKREKEFKAAEVRVKINILKERQDEAIDQRDYRQAQHLEKQLVIMNQQLEKLQTQQTEKVRVTKFENETWCKCLDILGCMLELSTVTKMTPSLITCRDNFLVPLISNQVSEVHWRVLKCLGLFSAIDKGTAEEYAKVLCIPIATYRTIQINNVSVIDQSITCVTDLIAVYGVQIVCETEEPYNIMTEVNATKRKLYNNEGEDDGSNAKIDNVTLSYIFEIFLDMLDDERREVRHKVVFAINTLMKRNFPVTGTILSRILLKWYSPLTAKQGDQVYLGMLIDGYLRSNKSCETFKEAIIPTLMSVAHAPRTSPLADLDIDNMLMFFSEMVNIRLQKDELRILSLDLIMKIFENTNDRVIPYLTKLLCQLDLHDTNTTVLSELKERAGMLLENVSDKISKRHVEKFIFKLKQESQVQTNTTVETTAQMDDSSKSESVNILREIPPDNEPNTMKEPQQVKRRKNRVSNDCVVFLENIHDHNNRGNETTLHAIPEVSMEMEIDEELNIENCSSDNSKISKTATRSSSVVISETSDSDLSNDNEVRQRSSVRCRKKRILF